MRLIDVDAFKRENRMADMCSDCDRTIRECEYDSGLSLMDFCGWLDDAPTIEKQEWIPCSERLPITNGVYIVARWFGDGCEKRILSDACYFDGSDTWYDDTRLNHGREYVTHKIVAWMPLPSPYKGEEE